MLYMDVIYTNLHLALMYVFPSYSCTGNQFIANEMINVKGNTYVASWCLLDVQYELKVVKANLLLNNEPRRTLSTTRFSAISYQLKWMILTKTTV